MYSISTGFGTTRGTTVHVEKYRSQKARGFMENERGISLYSHAGLDVMVEFRIALAIYFGTYILYRLSIIYIIYYDVRLGDRINNADERRRPKAASA